MANRAVDIGRRKPEDMFDQSETAGILGRTVLSGVLGYALFPALFKIQHRLGLPVPDLDKESVHFHHSVLVVPLGLLGIYQISRGKLKEGMSWIGLGIGIYIHHEVSEPELKGLEKFIHWNRS